MRLESKWCLIVLRFVKALCIIVLTKIAEYKQSLIKEMQAKEAAEKEKRAKAEKERKEKEAAMYAQQSLFGD